MSRSLRSWAKRQGFVYDRGAGAWVRPDGLTLAWCSTRYRVLTRGGGFHPTLQPVA